jgi:hypothetical protein
MIYFDNATTQDIERAKTLSKQNGAAILIEGRVQVDVTDLAKEEPNAHPSVLVRRMCWDLFPRSGDEGIDERILSGTAFILTGPAADRIKDDFDHMTTTLVDDSGRASGTMTLLVDGEITSIHNIATRPAATN